MDVYIWCDVEDGFNSHFYIKVGNDSIKHYYHWDSLLLWHDIDICYAKTVKVM